jgi:hypothetical protein
MSAGRHARSEVLAVLVAALALGGCEKAPSSTPAPEPSASSEEDLRAARTERAVAEALASVRSRLSLAAPEWELQPLATGRRLLVRLTSDKLEAYATPDLRVTFEKPLDGARAAVTIAGGSIVAVGRTESFRVDPGAKEPVVLPPLVYTPGTVLLPERRDSTALWNLERATRSLLKQPLAAGPKALRGEMVALEGYDGGPATMLRDGAVLYRAGKELQRAMPGSRPKPLKGAGLSPWRLAPGRRIDQAWAVGADGSVEHWQLTDRVQVLRRFALGAPPFDVASSETYLAAVVVEEGGSAPRRFLLRVFDEQGRRVLERALPPDPPARGEKWAVRATADRHVVLGDPEPIVAVGGPGALQVWSLPAGELLLER